MNTLLDTTLLASELAISSCELNHGPDMNEPIKATNMIILPFGKDKDNIIEVKRKLVIPVCKECIAGLTSDEWTLLYCFDCSASQWIYRPKAKMKYRHNIIWLRGCPDCGGEFGGIYFNDADAMFGEIDWAFAVNA